MPARTRLFMKLPWNGGLNTSIEGGVLNDNDLVIADNVLFASSGSRIKREGFKFLDSGSAVPSVTHRESTTTTKTVYFSATISSTSPASEPLVLGETLRVTTTATTGDEPTYATTTATVTTIASSTQVTDILCVADVAGSLDGKKFVLADDAGTVGFWFDVDDSGTSSPFSVGEVDREIEITTIATGDADTVVAGKVSTAVGADSKFSTSVSVATVTATSSSTGFRPNQSASTSGFTLTTTTPGTANGKMTYTAASATEGITATSTLTVDRNTTTLAVMDYWRTDLSNVKQQIFASFSNQGKLFRYDANFRRTEVDKDAAATALPTLPLGKVHWTTFNDKLLIAMDGLNNQIIKYNPDDDTEWEDLGGSPPKASMLQEHLGRLWTNDKADPDRLHYSTTGNPEEWLGTGDSGALDISPGDGDSQGITAIFPSFRGRLIVAKGQRLYQISGFFPETFQVVPISRSIGCSNPNGLASVDTEDLIYVSERGMHSIVATEQFGDFQNRFISNKIQPTFNSFNASNLDLAHVAYVPEINSVAFAVSEENDATNNNIYLYNTEFQSWYRWPNQSCTALGTKLSGFDRKLVIGTNNGRVVEAQTGLFSDFSTTGINYKIKTGTIYPGGDPINFKAFKRIGFLFKPIGGFAFTVRVQIDNQPIQAISFTQTTAGDKLGTEFILGTSVLGISNVLAPEMRLIDGIGRGLSIEITQTGTDETIEIHGFVVEYENVGLAQEIQTS